MAIDFYVPRYKIVNIPVGILSGVMQHNGRRVAFVDHRDAVTGRITREMRDVRQDTPFFILPGAGAVDESEMSEMTAYAREEGDRIARQMRERRNARNLTSTEYKEAVLRVLEQRKAIESNTGVSGPHHKREVLQ